MLEPDPNRVHDPQVRSGADPLTPEPLDSPERDDSEPFSRRVSEPQDLGGSEPFAQRGAEPRKQRIFEPQTRAATGSRTRSIPDAQARRMTPSQGHGAWLPIATATALVLAVGALLWAFLLQQRLTDTEEKLTIAEQGSTAFSRRLAEADAKIRANSANVDQQLTEAQKQQQELVNRAAIIANQQMIEASRLQRGVADTSKRLGAVQADVSSVKTEVASTKTEVAAARTDLADTKQILQRTIGDAGVMSGLIARNHDELQGLKHRGDRSYYEFTLQKNAPPTLLSTVKLQLKKTNEKKGRYTLLVSSDDRNIEKKDKTVLEPVQFYSGKNPQLFEIVVNSMGKNVVGGYLSVPKGL
ncbi:hypothetical protein [Terriglobus sp.]|uniref:hypothetical protein n=1 Tax=Terriglobus sp. TaxID=1889013 RepID=UPI003AFFA137